jgi:outer membrane protein OmpA-like peptidoglycan-associated protein
MRKSKALFFVLGSLLVHVSFAPARAGQARAKLVKVKLGPEINSPAREIAPLVSADGQTLYFTREWYVDDDLRKDMKAKLGVNLNENDIKRMLETPGLDEKTKATLRETFEQAAAPIPDEKIAPMAHQTGWVSTRQADGTWGTAKKLPPPLNNSYASYVCTVLPDGNTLVVGGIFDERLKDPMWQYKEIAQAAEQQAKSGQPFVLGAPAPKTGESKQGYRIVARTVRQGDGWTQPEYFRIHDLVNRADRNDYYLAPGNRVLIISITNDESVGDRDLFVSFLQKDGTWTRPKDLGTPVNSPGGEISPFVAPDGVTLYYASQREGGYGGYDLYMTRRLDDSWLRWSAPKNLGPEINSPENQTNISTDASGEFAFMAEGKIAKEDIYEFALPADVRPVPTAFVRGRAHDPGDNPVAAYISYERLRDGTGAGEANADRITGKYQVVLPIGESYGFRAEAPGYIAVSDRIDLGKAEPGEVFVRDLLLIPIKPGAKIRLNNIFFEFAQATLLPESKVELDRLVGILNQYPGMAIEVAGHTDDVGDDASNLKLSQDRAGAVMKYLLDHGVAAARLQARGYGESAPVAPNDTDEHRQLNRRVEFVILRLE